MATSTEGRFQYPTGRQGALLLGYDAGLIASLPDVVLRGFCGVGNPFSIAPIPAGATILDIGCGTGFDLLVAARLTGPLGRVCGVDLTEEMIARAQANIALTKTTNVAVETVDGDRLPYLDGMFDVVISNGVINLSPDKQRLFGEIFRVLKSGGRLQFADMVLEKPLPPELAGNVDSWSR